MSVSTRKEYSSIFYNNLGITRENLYDFSGELQISTTSFYPIACANFSGRIAEVLIWNLHETKCGYIVKVYSGSGKIISGYYWRTSFNLLSFNWVQNDTLLFVFENGQVFSYGSGRHHIPRKVLHLSNLSIYGVAFYNKGFVATTGRGSLVKVSCGDKIVKFVKMTLNTQDEDGNTTGLPMSAETTISDAAPGYTLTGPSSITEGNLSLGQPHVSSSYLFTASNMVPGTTVYWELRNYGSSSNDVDFDADFVTTRTGSGQVQTNGNVVELEFSIQIASDSLNESNENFKVIVWDASNNYDNTPPYNGAVSGALATKDVTIVSFNPVYQIVGDSTITEGQTKTYTFRASGHPVGETFWWELRNYGSNASDVDFAADFVTARTGSGPSSTVNGGFIEQDIIIEIDNDMDTDPGENFKLVLWADSSSYDSVAPYNSVASGALATKDITILDLAPQYVIDTASSQAEPSTLTATLNTRYVAAGTAYTWEVVPTGANPVEAADFVGGVLPSGSGTISTYNSTLTSSDTFDISVLADLTTEGTENYKIVVKVATVSVAEKTINVTDNSQTPAAQIHWLHWSSNAGYPSGSSLIVEPAGGWYLNNNTTTSDFDLIWADMVANQGTANNPDAIESYAASGGLTQSSIPNGTIGFNAIGAGNRYYIAIPQSMSGDPSSTALFQLPDSANANIVFSGRMAFNISSVAYWLYDVGLSLSPDALNLNLKNA